ALRSRERRLLARLVETLELRVGHERGRRVLAELERTHVGDDPPTILDLNSRAVAGHDAKTLRDHLKEVLVRRAAEFGRVKRRRLPQAPLNDHPRPRADPVVAGGAEDVVALTAALQVGAIVLEGKAPFGSR